LFKNLDDNKKLNADEIEELEVELGNVNDPDGPDLYEAYPEFDGTAGSAKKILKDSVEYEQSMFDQYKKEKSTGQGQFTKAQVLIERLKNTIKENPNDKYVQETFPNFIKEIENNPKLADDPNVQEAFGITDLSETTDQRLVEYPDGTLDFYTKGGQGGLTTGMDSVQSLMDELGISQEEALRIKQLEPEDQILEITKLRTLKDKPKKAQGGIVGLYI
jgi:soluble cytochrome b562